MAAVGAVRHVAFGAVRPALRLAATAVTSVSQPAAFGAVRPALRLAATAVASVSQQCLCVLS